MKKIFLCAICNIKSGVCTEDCKFCTQSTKYKAPIERYITKPVPTIIKEAKAAHAAGALGFCLVTSGKSLDDKTLEYVSEAAFEINKEVPQLRLIACNGTATQEQLQELKKNGLKAYNHNLETSQAFYPNICTTHSWDERFETCEAINRVGLKLISGGIFGMGETQEDRVSMLHSLKALKPVSVPINFYHHNIALPLSENPLTVDEALRLITLTREILDQSDRIMIAGGREHLFQERQTEIFQAGANSIVIGNYLTTSGRDTPSDLNMLQSLGYEIAQHVNDK